MLAGNSCKDQSQAAYTSPEHEHNQYEPGSKSKFCSDSKGQPYSSYGRSVSKRQSKIGMPSIQLMAIPPVRNNTRYIRRIVAAWFMVSSEILR